MESFSTVTLHHALALALDLSRLRLAIRTLKPGQELSRHLSECLSGSDLWAAETHFVWAMYLELFHDDHNAERHYLAAQKKFFANGLKRKAVKSYHNALASLSRLQPGRRLIYEYETAHREAATIGDYGTAGMALINLSREYQLLQANNLAMKTVSRALAYTSKHLFGSKQYYLALCHRAQLFLERDLLDLAALDYEEARCSDLPEVVGAVEVLYAMFETKNHSVLSPSASTRTRIATWVDRADEPMRTFSKNNALTDLECRLLEILGEGPHNKFELMEALYGGGNILGLENRLKQLLHRVRKKHPALIGIENGNYFLLDAPTMAPTMADI
jgi:hypothetical protein